MNKPLKRRSILSASPLAPLPAPQLDACAVSVRFGVAELMGLMVLCALVFGLLSLFRARWPVFLGVGLFMAVVAVAQALLYGGTRPRRAAALAGAVIMAAGPVAVGAVAILLAVFGFGRLSPVEFMMLAALLGFNSVLCAAFGALAGYAMGTLMAGVFLVVRILLGEYRLRAEVSLVPFGPEDVDTLREWLGHQRVVRSERWRWAGFPADTRQFLERFEAGDSEQPPQTSSVRRYKAVDKQSERMVGYAEIQLTDGQPAKGRLQLLCVAPDEPQRGLMGRAMVRALLCEAFEKLDLAVVDAVIERRDWEAETCYALAGFEGARLSWTDWLQRGREPGLRRVCLPKRVWQQRQERRRKTVGWRAQSESDGRGEPSAAG